MSHLRQLPPPPALTSSQTVTVSHLLQRPHPCCPWHPAKQGPCLTSSSDPTPAVLDVHSDKDNVSPPPVTPPLPSLTSSQTRTTTEKTPLTMPNILARGNLPKETDQKFNAMCVKIICKVLYYRCKLVHNISKTFSCTYTVRSLISSTARIVICQVLINASDLWLRFVHWSTNGTFCCVNIKYRKWS